MITGLYSLPLATGGDTALTQKVDQINYVIKGAAKMAIGDDVINLTRGSIIYVKAGTSHRFYDLDGDFQAYIMFAQP